MNKSVWSMALAVVFVTTIISGCATTETLEPIPATFTLSPIPPTFTPSPIPLTLTPEAASTVTMLPESGQFSVKIQLPELYKWDLITDQSDGNQYHREWVPEGSTGLETNWIIVEQKFVFDTPVLAEEFLITIFSLAEDFCTDILYNGPEKIEVNEHDTYVGRFMCAEQKGMGYGVFTDQRVVAQGNEVYVITSELRHPSSPKAGIVSFPADQSAESNEFMERTLLSGSFVRESVNICTSDAVDC